MGLVAILRSLSGWLWPLDESAYAADVQNEQRLLLARTSYVFAASGSTSIAILAVDFCHELAAAGLLVCCSIPALYIALLMLVRRWKRDRNGIAFHRRSVTCLALLGTAWGVLLIMLSGVHDVSQQRMVAALLIGVVSSPLMAAPFSAALAFWIPSATAVLIALCGEQDPFDPYLLAGTLGYLALTLLGIILVNRSLLERSASRIQLLHQNRTISLFLRDYEENTSDWIWETDASLKFCRVSPRFAQACGRSPDELASKGLSDLFCLATPSSEPQRCMDLLSERAAFRDLVLPIMTTAEPRWWSLTGRPYFDTRAQFQGYRGIGSDLTEIVCAQERIRYMATHDSLTGLANRQSLLDLLQAECECLLAEPNAASRGDGTRSLLLLDLDRFKAVNDSFGHAAGDALLIAVAGRLRELVREEDFVARLGGDEFAVLMGAADASEGPVLAARIVKRLSQPYTLLEARVTIGASVGLTFCPQDGINTVMLLRNADLALYAAKSQGRGRWQVFQPPMRNVNGAQAAMPTDLRQAIETGALFLEFQPVLRLPSRTVVAVEALLRWRHPTRGLITPMEFIPFAENAGLISRIGLIALREACKAAARWPASVRLSVNVSPQQLRNLGLPEIIDAVLAESGLAASRLELEITETAVLDATPQTVSMLKAISERGIRLVLDDFGTGHSSLNHLRTFRLDGLKLSAEFVRDLEHPTTAVVVSAIAAMSDQLGLTLTAEGVETEAQLERVQALSIDHVQGFMFSRPLDAAGIGALLWHPARLDGQGAADTLASEAEA